MRDKKIWISHCFDVDHSCESPNLMGVQITTPTPLHIHEITKVTMVSGNNQNIQSQVY